MQRHVAIKSWRPRTDWSLSKKPGSSGGEKEALPPGGLTRAGRGAWATLPTVPLVLPPRDLQGEHLYTDVAGLELRLRKVG